MEKTLYSDDIEWLKKELEAALQGPGQRDRVMLSRAVAQQLVEVCEKLAHVERNHEPGGW